MSHIVWAAILLVIGLALAALEVFIPSGGLIGFLAIASVVSSIVMGFVRGPETGFTFLGIGIVGLPVALGLALKYWPNTRMGRRVLLGAPSGDDVLPDDAQRRRLKTLVGKIGVAKSLMLPSGVVLLEGQPVDAVSEGMAIEAGQSVRVVAVRGTRVVVRFAEEEAPPSSPPDELSKPIESVGFDPFADSST